MKKRWFSFLLALCMCASLIPAGAASVPDGAALAADGDFGWDFDGETLTVSGPGAMPDYEYGKAPWSEEAKKAASLRIADGVTSIGAYAFAGCSAKTVTFSGDVTAIADYAFRGCVSLTDITFPGNVDSVGNHAFAACDALTAVTFSGNMRFVGEGAFETCDALASVTFSGKADSVGESAFETCAALTAVTFSGDAGSIGAYAFRGCGALDVVTFSGNVGSIGNAAFYGCEKLAHIYYIGSCEQWEKLAAKAGVSSLVTIHYKDFNWDFDGETLTVSGPGIMPDYEYGKAPWSEEAKKAASLRIADGVTSIGAYAFAGCSAKSVTFSGDVTAIADYAFRGCASLTAVTFPGNVDSIDSRAFAACNALTAVTFSGDVSSVGEGAFFACDALASVMFSGNAGSIGNSAFENCKALTVATFSGNVGSIGNAAFYGCEKLAHIYYIGSREQWEKLAANAGLPSTVTIHCQTYAVTFDANGGTVSPTSVTVTQGAPYGELPAPIRDGYLFDGWFTSADGGTEVKSDTVVNLTNNQTLYAHWQDIPVTYTVTFNANGGTVSPTSVTVTQGAPYGELPAPIRDGYQFDGWFTSADGGTEVKSDAVVNLSDNQTLYARWTPVSTVPGLAELTYAFANSASGLGYPKPYQIPYEPYKIIFGDTMFAKLYFKGSGQWGGNCYGFSSTAAMFSQSASGVETGAFRDGATLPVQLQTGDKNASLGITAREFLECMQVSQSSPLIQKDYQNNKNRLNELCAAVKAYQETGTNPVMVAVFGQQGGHALLAYKLEQDKLYVYDCNYPKNAERYITLTIDASGNCVGWYYHLNNVYDYGNEYKGSWISFVPYADFYSLWANRKQKSKTNMELLTVNADITLKDFYGVPLASVEDGELIPKHPDVFPLVEMGITSDGEAPKKDDVSFWIPVGVYDVERTDDYVLSQGQKIPTSAANPFKANVTHIDQSADVATTSDRFAFVVDDESQLNRVMFPGAAAEGTYDVTFQSTLTGEQQDARIVGSVSAQALTFGMVDGQAVADAASVASVEAYFVNGEQVETEQVSSGMTTLVTFSAHGGGGSMSPRAVENGKFTLPECEFAPPSPSEAFTGWMVDGVLRQPGETLELDADAEAVAQWSGYGIDGVTISDNGVTVKLTNALRGPVSVAACTYSESDKTLAIAVRTVDSGETAELTLSTDGAAYLKAFLLDPATDAPLCNPFRQKL